MTKRMARMHAMTTMPPTTTSRDAQRSARMRRSVRARLTTSGRVGDAGPPAVKVPVVMATLLDLRQLFLRDRGGDREVAVLDDALLPLPGDDHLDEFPGQRIERLAGGLVDVDEEETGHRIGPGVRVVGGGLHTLAAVLLAERHGPHSGGGVADPAVSGGEAVNRHSLHHGCRAWLLLRHLMGLSLLTKTARASTDVRMASGL